MHRIGRQSGFRSDRHAIAQQLINILVVVVQILGVIVGGAVQFIQYLVDLALIVPSSGQVARQLRYFDIAVVRLVFQIAEIAIAQLLAKQLHDAVLRRPFGLSNIIHD